MKKKWDERLEIIDEDINLIKNENDIFVNNSDYSRPKMLIFSGHDSTLTAEELFMIKFFGKKIEDYIVIFSSYNYKSCFKFGWS